MATTLNLYAVNQHIVNWLSNYAKNAGVDGFVVGISGGIDSAVTSTLCAQTGMKTVCVEMPIHQPESHVSRGKEHIARLMEKYPNVSAEIVDLTPVFDTFGAQVKPHENKARLDLTMANTRARLRMTALYYVAGVHKLLVAGTGNKIEDFGVGFYTKYGDGGVDISPIADLLKSEVRALGQFLDVPQSILQAKPADGLFADDRSDEDQLGATYDELEWAMDQVAHNRQAADFSGRQREVFEIYTRLNRMNRHKMDPIPVCLIPNDLK